MNKVIAKVALGSRTGNDDTGSRGNQQGRNLIYQSLAHGQQGIVLQRLLHSHIALHHADDEAADNVDKDNDDSRDGITLDELAGTIHGTVEVSLPLNLLSALAGLRIGNGTLIQIRINGHLLTRHSIQGEACRYLCHALRALGNNHELDNNQNDENDKAYYCITAHNEVTEGADELPCITLQQNKPGRGNIQCQPEQGCNQQKGREHGQIQCLHIVNSTHHNHQCQGNVHAQQQIQQQGRQRNNHHNDDCYDAHRNHYVTIFLYKANLLGGHNRCSHNLSPALYLTQTAVYGDA